MTTFNPNELSLIAKVFARDSHLKLSRKTEKPFDLIVEGVRTDMPCSFSAWLPLAVIQNSNWPNSLIILRWSERVIGLVYETLPTKKYGVCLRELQG